MIDVPEAYGGLGLDKSTSMRCRSMARCAVVQRLVRRRTPASGRCRIVYFGTEAQKKKYLPKLATGEMAAPCYALTEPGPVPTRWRALARGAVEARRQVLPPERRQDLHHQRRLRGPLHRLREGRRRAVLRLHRRARHARLTTGPEEKKMGIKGSSTVRCSWRTCRCPSRISSAKSARATRSRSTS